MEMIWNTVVYTLANAITFHVILPVWALFIYVRDGGMK